MAAKFSQKVTRRGFVLGATATAATLATAGLLEGCDNKSDAGSKLVEGVQKQFPDAVVEYLDVADTQILPYTNMNNVEASNYLTQTNSYELPLGSLVYQSSDSQALIMAPGISSQALIRLGFTTFSTGEFTPLLEQALGAQEDYVIYDARASETVIAWVECNMVHGLWRVYASPLVKGETNEEAMQQAQLLEEGKSAYSPPYLALAKNKVYWTVMPNPDGPASEEDSYLRVAEFSSQRVGARAEAQTIYLSHGRMITNPQVSGKLLTFVPRVDTDSVYYQLTTLDTESDAVNNIAILPPSLRVSDAVWLDNGFAFSIESNYDYAGGLSYFGTYQQRGDGTFLYVNKAPTSAPVQVGELTYLKSTKNVLGIDLAQDSVAIVDTPQDCAEYGDILGGAGKQSRLVTFSTIAAKDGKGAGTCLLRVFDAV